MPEDRKATNKADATILSDLQAKVADITAFAWDTGDPKITFTDTPTQEEQAQVCAYFARGDHKQFPVV